MNKLTLKQCDELIADGTITEGMIPKIKACKEAIQKGVESAHIVCAYGDSLINEIFTNKGSGTMIVDE